MKIILIICLLLIAGQAFGDVIDVVIDNSDPGFSAGGSNWITSSVSMGKYGTDYRYAYNGATVTACSWTPDLPSTGKYDVWIWYSEGANRSSMAPFTIYYTGGNVTMNVNQTINGARWFRIGTALPFAAGTSGYVSLANSTGESNKLVLADAVRFQAVPEPSSLFCLLCGLGGLSAFMRRRS